MITSEGGKSRTSTRASMCASSCPMVTMSRTRGILCRCTGSAVSRAAAMAGSAEFFDPLMRTVPRSGLPPSMRSRSITGCEAVRRACFLAAASTSFSAGVVVAISPGAVAPASAAACFASGCCSRLAPWARGHLSATSATRRSPALQPARAPRGAETPAASSQDAQPAAAQLVVGHGHADHPLIGRRGRAGPWRPSRAGSAPISARCRLSCAWSRR